MRADFSAMVRAWRAKLEAHGFLRARSFWLKFRSPRHSVLSLSRPASYLRSSFPFYRLTARKVNLKSPTFFKGTGSTYKITWNDFKPCKQCTEGFLLQNFDGSFGSVGKLKKSGSQIAKVDEVEFSACLSMFCAKEVWFAEAWLLCEWRKFDRRTPSSFAMQANYDLSIGLPKKFSSPLCLIQTFPSLLKVQVLYANHPKSTIMHVHWTCNFWICTRQYCSGQTEARLGSVGDYYFGILQRVCG